MQLENWGTVFIPNTRKGEPDVQALNGDVYGSDAFFDGTNITTSPTAGYDQKTEEVVTVAGGRYKLGVPAAAYEEMFPDAKNRLIKTLLAEGSFNNAIKELSADLEARIRSLTEELFAAEHSFVICVLTPDGVKNASGGTFDEIMEMVQAAAGKAIEVREADLLAKVKG